MIAAGYRITMDTDFDNAFVVHCDGDRQMRFVNRKGVYVLEQLGANVKPGAKETSAMYCQLSNVNKQPHFELSSKQNGYAGLGMTAKMATVQKNKEGFTPRQVKAAMEARSAMHILNAPSTKSLKYVIRSGLIKNCPITEEAINHAEAIFGPDASTLKGKSTQPTLKKTYDDFFSPPEELYQHNRSITVCIDHMEIENAKFLTTQEHEIYDTTKISPSFHITPMISAQGTILAIATNDAEVTSPVRTIRRWEALSLFGLTKEDSRKLLFEEKLSWRETKETIKSMAPQQVWQQVFTYSMCKNIQRQHPIIIIITETLID
ncbi:unnamed protein product [Cylindrotheca closterium]|uniref:Uncharacterized protein n=1 Tax=Cylindrotheca closterium TaxID=2856 RepID=A0AAD2CTX3_9STRA|nr:unnamed protein product [Cylindrotheca closterium]